MNTNKHHEISEEVAGALRSALGMYRDRFPPGSIPLEIEDWLVTVVPDMGEYYLVRVYYPAPKGLPGFPLFEAKVDKQTATCEITICRNVADIPPDLIAYDKDKDPV